ncbi:protein translocase subunit SecF [Sphingomonas sp. 1P06PA]|uniref:protein translocase subunit SecF n=1 Tax=Sphingomonas sp. 1P06PA TaxID=554121 RepID=UPI0039A5DE98
MRLLKLVPDNTNVDFMRWRVLAMAISIGLIVASLGLCVAKGFNLGIDFVGGQMLRATFTQPVALDDLRERVDALGFGESTIQEFGSDKVISIRLPLPEGGEAAANAAAQKVQAEVQRAYPGVRFDAVETVSGKVSNELYRTGAWAVGLAMLGIALYIWFRFEWQFGVGALFSLLHDVSLTLGFFALTQLEFNLNVVAAILTIVGYSLNDTIVVYDRIREDMRKYRKMAMIPLLNTSVNETLSRTIVTSLSMVMALLVLLFIGPDVIFGLTAAILIGIGIGTYSSIYVAAPILLWLNVSPDAFAAKAVAKGDGERVTRIEKEV